MSIRTLSGLFSLLHYLRLAYSSCIIRLCARNAPCTFVRRPGTAFYRAPPSPSVLYDSQFDIQPGRISAILMLFLLLRNVVHMVIFCPDTWRSWPGLALHAEHFVLLIAPAHAADEIVEPAALALGFPYDELSRV